MNCKNGTASRGASAATHLGTLWGESKEERYETALRLIRDYPKRPASQMVSIASVALESAESKQ